MQQHGNLLNQPILRVHTNHFEPKMTKHFFICINNQLRNNQGTIVSKCSCKSTNYELSQNISLFHTQDQSDCHIIHNKVSDKKSMAIESY